MTLAGLWVGAAALGSSCGAVFGWILDRDRPRWNWRLLIPFVGVPRYFAWPESS